LAEAHIYNPNQLQTQAWDKFQGHVRKNVQHAYDDMAFEMLFNAGVSQLPFSHFGLQKVKSPQGETDEERDLITLSYPNNKVAVLKVTEFMATKEDMKGVLEEMMEQAPDYLIIDLRGNTGGNLESALPLGQRLVSDTYYAGWFISRNYWEHATELPTETQYRSFPIFTQASVQLLFEGIHSQPGLTFRVDPVLPTYTGKVIVLQDRKTASTCEPFVYALKHLGIGTVVGQVSNGAMLNAERFSLHERFNLYLPTAEYYTVDGVQIDQVGVAPDVELPANVDALEWTLENLVGTPGRPQ